METADALHLTRSQGVAGLSSFVAAVEARARAVPVDYIRHARQQDHAMLVRRTREAAGPDADPIALAWRIAALPTWGTMAPGPCLTRAAGVPSM